MSASGSSVAADLGALASGEMLEVEDCVFCDLLPDKGCRTAIGGILNDKAVSFKALSFILAAASCEESAKMAAVSSR